MLAHGDEQLPPDCEWSGPLLKEWPQWLLESGLLGPVTLSTPVTVPLK